MSLVFSQQFIQLHSSTSYYKENHLVIWAQHIREFIQPYARSLIVENFSWFWYICLPELLTQRLNEYSNCMCALTLAYERYVMICKPHDKDVILTDMKRRRNYAALTSIILVMISFDGLTRYLSYDFDCSLGFTFYKNTDLETLSRLVSSLVTIFFFSGNYFLPVEKMLPGRC